MLLNILGKCNYQLHNTSVFGCTLLSFLILIVIIYYCFKFVCVYFCLYIYMFVLCHDIKYIFLMMNLGSKKLESH